MTIDSLFFLHDFLVHSGGDVGEGESATTGGGDGGDGETVPGRLCSGGSVSDTVGSGNVNLPLTLDANFASLRDN